MTARKPPGKAPVKKPRAKKPTQVNVGGRPTMYTEELADKLFARLAEGQSLRTVCKQDGMPSAETFFRWLRTIDGFNERYARAKQEAADALFEEIQDIADDGRNDWMEKIGPEGESQGWAHNGEHIQRSKLRVDTRKWMMAKMRPKKYGDRLDVDVRQTNEVDVLNEALARAGVKPE